MNFSESWLHKLRIARSGQYHFLMENRRRYLVLLVPLAMAGCADDYSGGYYAYDQERYPYYASGYDHTGYYGRPYYGSDNCGTPDYYRPCGPRWYRGY